MASPPTGSPPGLSSLPLPRQRPTLALPSKSRKPSLAPSTGSAHPLRQTSFPPPDSLEAQHQAAEDQKYAYSPSADDNFDFSDSEINSAISGPGGGEEVPTKKRKRGEKRPRGRPAKNPELRAGSVSVVNGDDGRSNKRGGTGEPSIVAGDGEDEEDDDDEDTGVGGRAAGDGFTMDAAELDRDRQNRFLFREGVTPAHKDRYDSFTKSRLNPAGVRKLVNATLSQSVPQSVVTVVSAYAKMFAGMIIEGAVEAQEEWMAASTTRPDGGKNRAYKRLRTLQPESDENESEDEEDEQEERPKMNGEKDDKAPNGTTEDAVDAKPAKHDCLPDGDPDSEDEGGPNHARAVTDTPNDQISSHAQTNGDAKDQPNGKPPSPPNSKKRTKKSKSNEKESELPEDVAHIQPGAWGLSKYIDECDRGPLLPDHLRESLRRYKKSRAGGTVGFTGISLERPEVAAPRMGGKRLFK